MMTSNSEGSGSLCSDQAHPSGLSSLLVTLLLSAMAGGMGWGIRGQYGHETGAMIAGVLVGMTIVLRFLPGASSLQAARIVSLCAVGVCFGGAMSYGQTLGLTQMPELVGNGAAWRWGMLGLLVKGGIWIGFAGAFLGMGLSGKKYSPLEAVLLILGMLIFYFLGTQILNEPFDPSQKVLPKIYFSSDWYWYPNTDPANVKPRLECWGGLLTALVGLGFYLGIVRQDHLARNLTGVGFLAGALGFPLGQCVQSFHAWNTSLFQTGWLGMIEPYMNWWNMMEITFGAVWGLVMALGVWFHRSLIFRTKPVDDVVLSPAVEILLTAFYIAIVVGGEFLEVPLLEWGTEYSLLLGIVPMVGILGGRYWPYLFALPLVAMTIAGKTLREMCYYSSDIPKPLGWVLLVVVPMFLLTWGAIQLAEQSKTGELSHRFARNGLWLAVGTYLALNFCFFRYAVPWQAWTGRTPSGIIFFTCAVFLAWGASAWTYRKPLKES